MMDRKIRIIGNAHWSARGSLESEMWNWGIEIDGELITRDNYLLQRTSAARDFCNEIKPYLPPVRTFEDDIINVGGRPYLPLYPEKWNMTFCDGIGGFWTFEIPLEETKNPEEVEMILIRYFPSAFKKD